MTRVQTVLIRGARSGQPNGTTFLHGGGGDDIGIARVRQPADIAIEFPSGSDRPVVGPAVRFAKKAVRRGLRWYVGPIMEHQSRVNHMMLDVMERLRLQNERLTADVEALASALEQQTGRAAPRTNEDA